MRPIASLLKHPFYPPACRRPTYTSLTLDAPGKKNRVFFALLFFARHRYMPPSAIFEALFPGTVYPPLFTMQIKAGPFLLSFFLWRKTVCVGRLTIQKIRSLNSRLLCILMSFLETSPGEFTGKAKIFSRRFVTDI